MNNLFLVTSELIYERLKKVIGEKVTIKGGQILSFRERIHNNKREPLINQKEMIKALKQYVNVYKREHSGIKELFCEQKEGISDDDAFKLLRAAPKGALLHVHSIAGLSVERLFRLFIGWNTYYKNAEEIEKVIVIREAGEPSFFLSFRMFEPGAEFVPVDEFLAGGKEIELKNALCFTEKKERVWEEFNLIYARTSSLFNNRDFYKEYHKQFFQECIEDHINYVEIRCGFQTFESPARLFKGKAYQPERHLFYQDMYTSVSPKEPDIGFLSAIHEAVTELKMQGSKLDVRVILTANRCFDLKKPDELKKVCEKIDAAITIFCNPQTETGRKFGDAGDMVIGFDFVNEEDKGRTTEECFHAILEKQYGEGTMDTLPDTINPKKRYEMIRVFLHDGESLTLPEKDKEGEDNVITGSICSANRIGHGFKMIHYPALINAVLYGSPEIPGSMRQKFVFGFAEPVLEVCPISNQLLGYYPDLRTHPAQPLMEFGINCVFANDDPQIFDNPGISYDLWEGLTAMGIDYGDIMAMVLLGYVYKHYDYKIWKEERERNHWVPNFIPDENAIFTRARKEFQAAWTAFLRSPEAEAFITKYSAQSEKPSITIKN